MDYLFRENNLKLEKKAHSCLFLKAKFRQWLMSTAISPWKYRFPSAQRSQARLSAFSTGVGDHPGTVRAVGLFFLQFFSTVLLSGCQMNHMSEITFFFRLFFFSSSPGFLVCFCVRFYADGLARRSACDRCVAHFWLRTFCFVLKFETCVYCIVILLRKIVFCL